MRLLILATAITAAASVAATAQLRPVNPGGWRDRPHPGPTLPPNATPTARLPGPTHRLTITYRTSAAQRVRPTSPDVILSCPADGAVPGAPINATCTADVPAGRIITVTGLIYTGGNSRAASSMPIKAQMWGGDCAGSTGSMCKLRMDDDHRVLIGL